MITTEINKAMCGLRGAMAVTLAAAVLLVAVSVPLYARNKPVTDGKGKMVYLNGDVYNGNWQGGLRYGHGKLKTASGDVYEGEWVADQLITGKVRYKDKKLGTYEGSFRNLKPDGYGKLNAKNLKQEGRWLDGKPEGIIKEKAGKEKERLVVYRDGKRTNLTVNTDGPVMGVDMSRYQSDVVWPQLYLYTDGTEPDFRTLGADKGNVSPVEFVILKATEGGDHVDRMLATHTAEARRHNFVKGFYHFYNTTSSASVNAANYIANVHLDEDDLPPILDIEREGESVDSLLHWMHLVEKHFGRKPMIYTNERYYKMYVEGTPLEKYPLWYSRYGRKDIDRGARLFQFTDQGLVDGIRGSKADINVIRRGSLKDIIKSKR
ncbi:MAG: hypothetical protein K2J29_04285 [Muribaculaceae bacterium]|nr:hypothetical protein [Bacteroides sp.]MDE6803832.1 hypothetical protein [Muribaculaceae bacterium]MDE6843878.1 hypothetical protein [Muribaculaceae bacterium]MDE7189085.1 hypothetical protein [Muribaculaceae bacterium]